LQSLIKDKLSKLEYNKVYTGNVTGTTDFGIFVEFETCLTGMIHKANVNAELVPFINKIEPGTEIEFYIKEVVKDKLILTQILRQTLWDTLKIGDRLPGRVKVIKNFGALISLDEETNGLIHNSELEKQNQKIHEGQEIKVKVISVQRAERKIFLSFDN
jgi:predicted RNA-binding protein with RPS1 domain